VSLPVASSITALLLAAVAVVACGDESPPVATETPTLGSTSASAPEATAPASGSAVATSPQVIFTPTVTPTPAIAGEPIARTANIPRGSLPVAEFTRAGNLVARLPIEVPPRDEYSVGFSGRRTLGDERGMLFYYADKGGAFWMFNTHYDLAIAFVAADETIVDIQEMQAESTMHVNARAEYKYAIEAPAGWYLKNGVRTGDRAKLAFSLPPYLN
jgi:uncharacterized membrane protein (UPF0127 family)